MDDDVTIRVKRRVWERLHRRKGPGDSFSQVIEQLLDDERGVGATDETQAPTEPVTDNQPAADATHTEPRDTDAAVAAIVNEVAASWAADGRREARKEAARRVLAHAMGTDEAVGKSSAIVDTVFGECPVPGQDRETWWRKNIRPVLKEAGEYSNGRHGYVVAGEE
jgi:hypothetical protein